MPIPCNCPSRGTSSPLVLRHPHHLPAPPLASLIVSSKNVVPGHVEGPWLSQQVAVVSFHSPRSASLQTGAGALKPQPFMNSNSYCLLSAYCAQGTHSSLLCPGIISFNLHIPVRWVLFFPSLQRNPRHRDVNNLPRVTSLVRRQRVCY